MDKKKFHKTSVGGQALIEGIMMRGPKGIATAVRNPKQEIVVDYHDFKNPAAKISKIPLVRGVVAFVQSMIIGYKCLMHSADVSGMDDVEGEELGKFDKWLLDKFGDKLMNFIMILGSVLGVALAFVIFFYLPVLVFNLLNNAFDGALTFWQGTFESVMKIIIFVVYIALVARMKDIRRTFMYHGAEHKTITCYERGEELTVENVRRQCRFHPRCGTSFIFVMLILSIFISTPLSLLLPQVAENRILWLILKLLILPVIMGIGYEFIKYAGRHDNLFVKILSAPGLWMQRLTTKEPDDSMIEVGIAAFKAVITDNPEDDEIK